MKGGLPHDGNERGSNDRRDGESAEIWQVQHTDQECNGERREAAEGNER